MASLPSGAHCTGSGMGRKVAQDQRSRPPAGPFLLARTPGSRFQRETLRGSHRQPACQARRFAAHPSRGLQAATPPSTRHQEPHPRRRSSPPVYIVLASLAPIFSAFFRPDSPAFGLEHPGSESRHERGCRISHRSRGKNIRLPRPPRSGRSRFAGDAGPCPPHGCAVACPCSGLPWPEAWPLYAAFSVAGPRRSGTSRLGPAACRRPVGLYGPLLRGPLDGAAAVGVQSWRHAWQQAHMPACYRSPIRPPRITLRKKHLQLVSALALKQRSRYTVSLIAVRALTCPVDCSPRSATAG